jgi:CRISPR-associated protein Csm5
MLLDIGNRRPDTETVKAIQRFFFERRERLMPFAVQHLPVLLSIGRFYADRVGQTANRESSGQQVINRLEIDRTSFDPISRRPVLYGSSLKGAMRTALLDREDNGQSLKKVEDRRAQRLRDENNQELQHRLFQFGPGKFELDPLRLLHVADAPCVAAKTPNTQVWLAVDRKKAPVVDVQKRLRKSQAESKDLYQILECVLPWQHRAFAGQINIPIPEGIPLQDHRSQRQLPARSLWPVMVELARACNRFYGRRLDAELQVLRDRGYIVSNSLAADYRAGTRRRIRVPAAGRSTQRGRIGHA